MKSVANPTRTAIPNASTNQEQHFMNNSLKHALLTMIVAAISVTAQADVNITSWGGAYTAAQQKAYADTWKKGKVNFINYEGGLDGIRLQVASGNVTWDIVDVLPHEARVGCDEGLFEKLDRSMGTPALSKSAS